MYLHRSMLSQNEQTAMQVMPLQIFKGAEYVGAFHLLLHAVQVLCKGAEAIALLMNDSFVMAYLLYAMAQSYLSFPGFLLYAA